MPPKHIVIVGAGLAGPCLGLSLARHNISSTIYDIRAGRSDQGGSISLAPNALKILDNYAGVYETLKSIGFTYSRFQAYTEEGEQLGEIKVGEERQGGYDALRIMRSELHKTLLDAAEETGLVEIKWGAKMTGIEEGKDGVVVTFEDGSEGHGDILIGADGIHSKVREHVLGDQAPSETHDGLAINYGFVDIHKVVKPSADFRFPAFIFTRSGMLMTIPHTADGQRLAWGINKPMANRSRDEWRAMERTGEALRLAKADYDGVQTEPVRSLLDNVEGSGLWAASGIPKIARWHTERVCLIGDAAHGMPPNGQGSGLAFEDAALLTRLLTGERALDYADLFDRFQALREPRIDKVRKTSKTTASVRGGSTNPIVWWLKKMAFRIFFWWKGGVISMGSEHEYDVDEVKLVG